MDNVMINKRLKSTQKVIKDRCSNIINQENNKVEENLYKL